MSVPPRISFIVAVASPNLITIKLHARIALCILEENYKTTL